MRWRLRYFLAVLYAAFPTTAYARSVLNEDHVVHTLLGTIRGIPLTFRNERVSAFLGVPYARPPIGVRRFAKPEMVEPWSGEFEARQHAKTCFLTIDTSFPQFPGAEMWNPPNGISEDCLNMNIWVPANHDGSVLVWIFGGGFFSGSPSLDLYDGTALAAMKRTIVVNINYRLGPFGFLYLGDESPVPGNMGLLDQQAALRWLHENIGSFGGDPSRVTLFGESAGSAAATAHLAAPGSYSYFSKIIASSGTIMNSWASRTPKTMLELSMRLAKRLNCTSKGTDVTSIYNCLRGVSASVVQEEADVVSSEIGLPMTFAFVPVSEDRNFFKGDVFDRLRKRNFKKDVAVIFGTVKDEGTYWLPYYMSRYGFWFNHTISAEDPKNMALITREQYQQSIKAFMPYFGGSALVEHALLHAYQSVSPGLTLREQLRDGVGRFLGDYFFTCSVIEFADIIADNVYGPVYMYYFTMRSTANPWPKWMGVMHGYEIEYVFGQPLRRPSLYDKNYLRNEQLFSEFIMKLWTDFANTGTPATYWPRYNRIDRETLELGEKSTNGEHRVVTDVNGPYCRLIEEAETVAGQVSDCRARRTQSMLAIGSAANDASSPPNIAFLTVVVVVGTLRALMISIERTP